MCSMGVPLENETWHLQYILLRLSWYYTYDFVVIREKMNFSTVDDIWTSRILGRCYLTSPYLVSIKITLFHTLKFCVQQFFNLKVKELKSSWWQIFAIWFIYSKNYIKRSLRCIQSINLFFYFNHPGWFLSLCLIHIWNQYFLDAKKNVNVFCYIKEPCMNPFIIIVQWITLYNKNTFKNAVNWN